jgi:hypothetical protein
MRDLGFGPIILVIVFILVPLIQFVMRRVRRRLENQILEKKSVTQIRRQAQATRAPLATPRVSRNTLHQAQEPTVATPRSRRRLVQREFLINRRDARRGIIVMTLLGPCRTFDPLD